MNNLQLIDNEVVNFGKLYDRSEQGKIRVVQTPVGEEIMYVIGAR